MLKTCTEIGKSRRRFGVKSGEKKSSRITGGI
jgi:hypothetical protein